MAGQILTLSQSDGVAVAAPSSFSGVYSATGAGPSYTILDTDGYSTFISNNSSGTTTFTLPTAANNTGRMFLFVNNVARTLSIVGTISGGTNRKLTAQYASIRIYCDGSAYHSISVAGEWQENARTNSSINATTATTFSIDSGNTTFNDGNETGIALGAGEHDISASAWFDIGASDAVTEVRLFVGTATGTTATGMDEARNFQENELAFTTAGDASLSIPPFRINITSATTYYLKARVTHTGGNCAYRGSIRARLVR
jgi:hypothetical protein